MVGPNERIKYKQMELLKVPHVAPGLTGGKLHGDSKQQPLSAMQIRYLLCEFGSRDLRVSKHSPIFAFCPFVYVCAEFEEQLYDTKLTGQTFRHPSSQSSDDTSTSLSRSPISLNNKRPDFIFLVNYTHKYAHSCLHQATHNNTSHMLLYVSFFHML